jgi:hypothetical protein
MAPTPAWQFSGAWYSAEPADAPASLHVARCTEICGEACAKDTEAFGQINAREITTLEIEVEGRWHRFPVSAPGFAVRLDGFQGTPTAYRWLDAGGRVVWSAEQDRSRITQDVPLPGHRPIQGEHGDDAGR